MEKLAISRQYCLFPRSCRGWGQQLLALVSFEALDLAPGLGRNAAGNCLCAEFTTVAISRLLRNSTDMPCNSNAFVQVCGLQSLTELS